jgi:hypothetical protein
LFIIIIIIIIITILCFIFFFSLFLHCGQFGCALQSKGNLAGLLKETAELKQVRTDHHQMKQKHTLLPPTHTHFSSRSSFPSVFGPTVSSARVRRARQPVVFIIHLTF